MALSYPIPTVTTAEFIDAAEWNALVDSINFHSNPPACRVYHTAAQSVPNNTDTVAAFNSERYDTAGLHSTSTNTSRITFPVAGLYLLTFNGEFAAAADYTQTFCYIRLGGATIIGFGNTGAANTVSEARFLNVATTYKFAAAEYVEVVVKQSNSAAAARNLNTAANRSPEFTATWVGLG